MTNSESRLKRSFHLSGTMLIVLCLALLLGAPADAQPTRRILLLNAYSYDLSWTASITKGVEETLSAKDESVKLSVEFMDTKNFYSEEYLNMLVEQYRHKYNSVLFDVIITSDDNAANFAMEYRDELFNGAPIIFCGVNNLDFPKQDNFTNITGVLESPDIAGSIAAALMLQQNLKTIYCIIDNTTTGKLNRTLVEGVLPQFKGLVDFVWLEELSMDELKEKLASLPDNSATLLITFNRDRLGNWFSFSECISHLYPVSRSPIYSMWDFYLGEGIVGGMLTSGQYQGTTAANMALRIMGGEKIGNIPVVIQKANRYMFDYDALEKFGLKISLLPNESILINVPKSIFDEYAYEIFVISGTLVFMLLIIFKLLSSNRGRRKAEAELEELNQYQETLIEQRTQELMVRSKELEMANYELKKVDELKTAVLNTVSHDLRTPLTSVLGFCKIIDRDFKRFFLPLSSDTDELRDKGNRITANLGIIDQEGDRLTRLINDFLDLSKIESGKIAWNDVSVDPEELITQALPVLEGYFSESDVSLSVNIAQGLPKVTLDPDRMLQVLNNLVGNAAKFTSKGTVVVSAGLTEGGWLKVDVADTGIGIPSEDVERIFDKFYQARQDDTAAEISRGSGMGLAISKRIIEHYGGSISVTSSHKHGSAFTFTIPSAR